MEQRKIARKNWVLKGLLISLRKAAAKEKVPLWSRLAEDLAKPTRRQREVNVNKIEKHSKSGEIVVVPGKVLASGDIKKAVTVSAYSFSEGARAKIAAAKGKTISIQQLLKENPKGKKVRIIG